MATLNADGKIERIRRADRVAELHASGMTYAEIGAIMGISSSRAQGIAAWRRRTDADRYIQRQNQPADRPGRRRLAREARKHRSVLFATIVAEALAGPCVDCGGRFHIAAMDFDDGDSTPTVKQLIRGESELQLRRAIDTRDRACANCLAIRRAKR